MTHHKLATFLAIVAAATALMGATVHAGEVGLADDASSTCERQLVLRNVASKPVTIGLPGVAPRLLAGGKTARWCATSPETQWTASTTAWLYRGQVNIASGERRVITLAVPGATVVVINLTGELQSIALDGAVVARVAPGEQKTLGPIAAGERVLQAKSLRSSAMWATTLKLRPGATSQLRLPAAQGVLRVQNPLSEVAALALDGRSFGNVEPEAKLTALGFAPGGHEVQWLGRDTGKVAREVAQADDPHERASPRVKVALHNRTGEILDVPAGLRDVGTSVAPRAKLSWSLPRGEYGIVLTGQRSGLPYRLDVRKRGPALLQWEIRRPVATLRLVNASGQALQAEVPTLGPLPMEPGSRALLRVPAGKLAVAARLPGRDKPLEVKMFLRANQEAVWNIASRSTYVVAKSTWNTPVEVYVDGRRAGTIKPTGDYRIPLVAGRHAIEARVAAMHWRETAQVDVNDGDHGVVRFSPPSGAVHIDNEGGEAVEFWLEGSKIATVSAGRSAMVPAGPGTVHGQVATPGLQPSPRNAKVMPTQQVQVAGPALKAVQVELLNSTGAAIEVAIDQDGLQALAAEARRQFGPVSVGVHLVRIVREGIDLRGELRIDGSRSAVQLELKPASK